MCPYLFDLFVHISIISFLPFYVSYTTSPEHQHKYNKQQDSGYYTAVALKDKVGRGWVNQRSITSGPHYPVTDELYSAQQHSLRLNRGVLWLREMTSWRETDVPWASWNHFCSTAIYHLVRFIRITISWYITESLTVVWVRIVGFKCVCVCV